MALSEDYVVTAHIAWQTSRPGFSIYNSGVAETVSSAKLHKCWFLHNVALTSSDRKMFLFLSGGALEIFMVLLHNHQAKHGSYNKQTGTPTLTKWASANLPQMLTTHLVWLWWCHNNTTLFLAICYHLQFLCGMRTLSGMGNKAVFFYIMI